MDKSLPKIIDTENSKQCDLSNLKKLGSSEDKPLSTLKTLEISIDNKLIYASGYDVEHVIVIDIKTLKFKEFLKHHTDCVFCLATDANKKILVTGGRDRKMAFWKIKTLRGGGLKHEYVTNYTLCNEYVLTIRIAKSANKIFALFQNNFIYEFDSKTFSHVNQYKNFYNYFNDSYFAVNALGTSLFGSFGSNSNVYHYKRLRKNKKRGSIFYDFLSQVSSFDIMENLSLVVMGSSDGILRVFDLKTNKMIFKLKQKEERIYNISVSAKKNLIALSCESSMVILYKVYPNKQIKYQTTVILKNISAVEGISFSLDGETLVAGGGGNVSVFEVKG
jgi:WD40 repeat protein